MAERMSKEEAESSSGPSTSHGDKEKPSYTDFICVICLQLLVEPVVLPCKHELCMTCFKEHVHSTSLCCPMCRTRISSWARKKSREGNLVDKQRWDYIQKLFPERCKKRLNGEDDDEDYHTHSSFSHVVARQGELRKEYEVELKKVIEERAKENQASEEVIRVLLKEEEAYQIKIKEDEKIAKELQKEELKVVGEKLLSPNSKLEKALSVLKLPKEMTLRSSSHGMNKGNSSVNEKSNSCMTKWLSKSPREPLEILPVGSSNRTPHRSKQVEDDFHMAFKLQKQLDLEGKKATRNGTLNEQFFSPKKTLLQNNLEPPSKRLKKH